MAMTKKEYMLVKLSEECSEVIQAVSKCLRFGVDNHHPLRVTTNEDELAEELVHLETVINILQQEYGLRLLDGVYKEEEVLRHKKQIDKFMKVSEESGCVEVS